MPNIYVSPTGNDATGDGSSGNPYEHIHKGIDVWKNQRKESKILSKLRSVFNG